MEFAIVILKRQSSLLKIESNKFPTLLSLFQSSVFASSTVYMVKLCYPCKRFFEKIYHRFPRFFKHR